MLSILNDVISTNESTGIITGHVIYNPAYTYKFQLKTTIDHEMIDAAKINNTALLKCLLLNGANVNAVDSDGISALTYIRKVCQFNLSI